MHAALFALMSGDHLQAQTNMSDLAGIVGEHDLAAFGAFDVFSKAGRPSTPARLPRGSRECAKANRASSYASCSVAAAAARLPTRPSLQLCARGADSISPAANCRFLARIAR
jgi:hypothetical protein